MIPLDSDLQDPPELIPVMVEKWREGYEVVLAKRVDRRSDDHLKRWSATTFYRVNNMLSNIQIPENVGDYRLMDRMVVDVIKRLPENNRFMKGLFAWAGFRQTEVPYTREARHLMETKWNYWQLWNFALEGITSFSTLPLRVWSYLGFFVATFAAFWALFLIVRTIIYGIDLPGYASIMVVNLFMGGILLLGLGVIGEYIGRIYAEVKRRPLYVLRKVHDVTVHQRDK